MKPALTFSVSLLFCATSAAAQPKLDPREANTRYEEGVTLFSQKKFAEARVKFLEACAAQPTPKCEKNLAAAEVELGLSAEAATHFRQYLDDPNSARDAARTEVERLFARAKSQCAEVTIEASPGAAVKVDSLDLGNAPFHQTFFVAPGPHNVTATLVERKRVESVGVEAGRTSRVSVVFVEPTQDPHETPTTSTTTTHAVVFPPPAGAIVLVALGLVGVGFGIGFGVDSTSRTNDFQSQAKTLSGQCAGGATTAECNSLRDARSSAETSAIISMVGYVAGGVALVGGVLWWVLAPRKATEHIVLAPSVGPTSFGVSGAFAF